MSFSAVTSCNSFIHESLEKILPLKTFNLCDWAHSKSHTQYPYQATVHSLRWTSSSQMLAQMMSTWTPYGSLT